MDIGTLDLVVVITQFWKKKVSVFCHGRQHFCTYLWSILKELMKGKVLLDVCHISSVATLVFHFTQEFLPPGNHLHKDNHKKWKLISYAIHFIIRLGNSFEVIFSIIVSQKHCFLQFTPKGSGSGVSLGRGCHGLPIFPTGDMATPLFWPEISLFRLLFLFFWTWQDAKNARFFVRECLKISHGLIINVFEDDWCELNIENCPCSFTLMT